MSPLFECKILIKKILEISLKNKVLVTLSSLRCYFIYIDCLPLIICILNSKNEENIRYSIQT